MYMGLNIQARERLSFVWWCPPVILALWKLRQEGRGIISLRLAWATETPPPSYNSSKEEEREYTR